MLQIPQLCITVTKSLGNYCTSKTKNQWSSVEAHYDVLSLQHLPPSIIVVIMMWTYWLSFWQIQTRPCGKAEGINVLALFTFILPEYIYLGKRFIAPSIYLFINWYSQATAHDSVIIYLLLKLSVKLHTEAGESFTHTILLFFDSLISPSFNCIDHHPHIFSLSLSLSCWPNQSGNILCGTCILLLRAFWIVDAFVMSYIRFNVCSAIVFVVIWIIHVAIPVTPIPASEMPAGAQSSSPATGWQLLGINQQTFFISVCPPGRPFADKAGGKSDLSDNLYTATPSCWKSEQDALMIFSLSEMYPTAVLCMFSVHDSFCVVCRFWLLCYIIKKSWTLAAVWNCLFSASIFISMSFSDFIITNTWSSLAKILVLAWHNNLQTSFSQRVSPVVFDCLPLWTSHPREVLASTPTSCGVIVNMLRASLERSVYSECVSSWWHHQSVTSKIRNVRCKSIGLEWL